MSTSPVSTPAEPSPPPFRNEVRLVGRSSGVPERRSLPSGDEVVLLRVVVPRAGGGADTLPVRCGPAPKRGRPSAGQVGRRLLARAERLAPDSIVDVRGVLRRRWWAGPDGRASRIEVAASQIETVGAGES